MYGATSYDVGPQFLLQAALSLILVPIGGVIFFLLLLRIGDIRRGIRGKIVQRKNVRPSPEEIAEREKRQEVEEMHRRDERARRAAAADLRATERWRRERELRADPRWSDAVLDRYLKWLLSSPDESSMADRKALRQVRVLQLQGQEFELKGDEFGLRGERLELTGEEIEQARDRARREGLAVHDGRRWRLTRRGRRIFEEYAGDRKRMNDAERKRNRPQVKIDARGAGAVAHTINGGVHGTTVNNTAPSTPTDVDLSAALQLVEQLRMALSEDANGLSDLLLARATGDLNQVDRELRAADEERDPSRIRAALDSLTSTLLGVGGLVEVVNQLRDHLSVWFRV